MKKIAYIFLFVILGILLQFIIHSIVEIIYVSFLVSNFSKYSFGLTWPQMLLVHHIISLILLAAGIFFGFWQGKYWWQKIYQIPWYKKIINIFKRSNN